MSGELLSNAWRAVTFVGSSLRFRKACIGLNGRGVGCVRRMGVVHGEAAHTRMSSALGYGWNDMQVWWWGARGGEVGDIKWGGGGAPSATCLSRFWGRKVKSVRRKIGQAKKCIEKDHRTKNIPGRLSKNSRRWLQKAWLGLKE